MQLIQKGGVIMYPLLACSVISLTIIIERAVFWFKEARKRNRKLIDRILSLIEKGQYSEAADIAQGSGDFIVRQFQFGLEHHHASLEGALEMAAKNELKRMGKYLNVLDTIVTVAPLLGILGTVVGIIISFDVLGASGVEDPKAVMGGIAQALITTAVGLTIAIFTVITFNFFSSKLQDATSESEVHLTNFEILYKKGKLHNEN